MEDRTVPSGTPPTILTSLPDAVLAPNQELNKTVNVADLEDAASVLQWEAEFGTKAFLLDLQFDLRLDRSFFFNFSGFRNEKWVRAVDGTWFFILPNGSFHLWDAIRFPTDAVGPLITQLDPIYHLDPFLLIDANNPSNLARHQENLDVPFVLDTTLDLLDPNDPNSTGLWENWGGANERWIKGKNLNGNTAWFFILPNGDFFQWDGTPFTARGFLIARLHPMFYEVDMIRELSASGGTPAPNPPSVTVSFNSPSSSTFSNTLIVNPNNHRGTISVQLVIRDDGGNDLLPGRSRIFDVTFVNREPNLLNPGLVPVSASSTTNFNLVGNDDNRGDTLTADIGFASNFLGAPRLEIPSGTTLPDLTYRPIFDNFFGAGERWFLDSATGNWYFINRTGDLFLWNRRSAATGRFLGKLPVEYNANPILLDIDTVPLPAGFTGSISVTNSGEVTVNIPSGFAGFTFPVIAELNDGMESISRRFQITVS